MVCRVLRTHPQVDLLFGKFEEGMAAAGGGGGDRLLIGVLRRMVDSDKQVTLAFRPAAGLQTYGGSRNGDFSLRFCISNLKGMAESRPHGKAVASWPAVKQRARLSRILCIIAVQLLAGRLPCLQLHQQLASRCHMVNIAVLYMYYRAD